MPRRPEPSEGTVDALHQAVLRGAENVPRARALLAAEQPDTLLLVAVLRRVVPAPFLEALALTPPWSRDGRVLAGVVMSRNAFPRLSVPPLPALFWADLAEVARTLRLAPPVRARAESLLVERLPDLRLGERVSLARMATPPVLRALLRDVDPRVVQAALPNPRLREEDVLVAVRAEDASLPLLEAVAASRRWQESYLARLELVLQRRTPLGVALAQLTSLLHRDLLRVAENEGLRPIVQAAALRAAQSPEDPPGGPSRGGSGR